MVVKDDNFSRLKESILKVLIKDPKKIPLKVLMIKVFNDLGSDRAYIGEDVFMKALEELTSECLIGKNQWNKYYIDYLDYPESGVEGEGYLEIDSVTGNGYITQKINPREYKKSSHFVHRKNLAGCKHGDYVKFVELSIHDKEHFRKFSRIDAKIKCVIDKPL